MNFGRGLASIALFGLGAYMLYHKISPCGMGILMVLGLSCIWHIDTSDAGTSDEEDKESLI